MPTRRLALMFGCLLLAATPAAAQTAAPPPPPPPPMFSSADADAAKAVIHRYFAAFTAKDYAVFRQVFNAPFVTSGRQYATLDFDQVMTLYEGIRNPLDQADYSASEASEIKLIPLHANSVLANVHWRRFKKDNSLLNEGAEVLMLVRVDGQWKISGVLGEDLRQYKAGN